MIPKDHPRYQSLVVREHMAECARNGIVALESLTSHGRGEAFDYMIGERTTSSALIAEKTAAAFLLTAENPVISVNGNNAALAAKEIAELQHVTGAKVEVNLFHRTEERVKKIENFLRENGVDVFSGPVERLLPLSHDRALCRREGIFSADVILVSIEDGDRCEALIKMGKTVIAIDLNPLSRTARAATLTIVDELTRALPNIIHSCKCGSMQEHTNLLANCNNQVFLSMAKFEMMATLSKLTE